MRRALIAAVTLALAVPAIGGADARTQAARGSFAVPTSNASTGFGPFSESNDGGAKALRRAFGPADRADRVDKYACRLRWGRLGIRAEVTSYGLVERPCRNGYFREARLTDRRWHTSKGVHPGSSKAKARRVALRRCRPRTCQTRGYVLGLHRSECAAGRWPGVIAQVRNRRVVALIVEAHNCE